MAKLLHVRRYATVNGEGFFVDMHLAAEFILDNNATLLEAYATKHVENEAAYHSEKRWGPGTLTRIGSDEYTWQIEDQP